MIKAIIYELNAIARHTRSTDRNFPNVSNGFLEGITTIPLGQEARMGFLNLEEAKAVREELARRNPGKMYALASIVDVMECPPGDIQQKRFNTSGELVNV